jgi:hypothetical protein
VKVPECAVGCGGSVVCLCLHCLSMLAPCQRVSYNGLRLKKVGDFEAQTFF